MINEGDFPVDKLPAWCDAYGVKLNGVKAAPVDNGKKGNGLVATERLHGSAGHLLEIPRQVVVSADYVKDYAGRNQDFLQLVHALPEFCQVC